METSRFGSKWGKWKWCSRLRIFYALFSAIIALITPLTTKVGVSPLSTSLAVRIRVHDCIQKLVYRVPFPRYHGHTALCDELQFLAREYADIAQLYR